MKSLLLSAFVILFACCVWADHDLDIYSFDNLFIFDTFIRDVSSRRFNVVILDDTTELKTIGQVETQADHNVDAYSNYKSYLIVLLWNQVEVYDLRNPIEPTLVKSFELQEHESWPGCGRIIKDDKKFLLLSTKTTAELMMDDDIAKWKINKIRRTKELHEKTLIKPAFPPFDSGLCNLSPFVVRETDEFRYEICWKKEDRGKHVRAHKKYLRQVRKKNGEVVSNLFLGEIIQTGGS